MTEPLHTLSRLNACATAFILWAESGPAAPPDGALTAIRLLSELLAAAVALPAPESFDPDAPDADEATAAAKRNAVLRALSALPFRYYSGVFETLSLEAEATIGDITDDRADIYADLSYGALLFRGGHVLAAHHHYYQSFYSHWGEHLTDALRALLMSVQHSQLERSWTFPS